jgi:hypothetical protein
MADKAPYKLTVKIDSERPDAIGQALSQLREIAGEHDQVGKGSATITIESYLEHPLSAICEAFEEWLWQHQIGLGCEMTLGRPGVRPEMAAIFRARKATPMDRQGWEGAQNSGPIVIASPLALPMPNSHPMLEVDEGSYTVEE